MKEIKQLTPEEINEYCDKTIHQLKNKHSICLCYALKNYLESKDIYDLDDYNNASQFIPEFTNENAVKHANADNISDNEKPWWNNGKMFYSYKLIPTVSGFDFDNRILFLEWLKSQYPVTPEEE